MQRKVIWGLILLISLLIMAGLAYLYFQNKNPVKSSENLSHTAWTNMFGIDISHYQGPIDWSEVNKSGHDIQYIFIRATMGKDGKDLRFTQNWTNAKQYNFIRGAYHYYRPSENSTQQFNNFKATVTLEEGDIVPILDIEEESPYGRENLRTGVLNWLQLAEQEYGVKPMIYTGANFYQHVLKGHVDDYPLWIAAYAGKHRLTGVDWTFHQFSDHVRVRGIRHLVDGNNFRGDTIALQKLLK